MRVGAIVVVLLVLAGSGRAEAAEGELFPLDARQVLERWHSRLDRRHFTAKVELHGESEIRKLTVWREDDGGQSDERVMVRFYAPPDLRNVGLLYFEQRDRPNDYFLYQPLVKRMRRIPENLATADVFGVDLEFLGFGVAQTEPTAVVHVERVHLGKRATYKLVERALRSNARFERRSTWLDATSFLAVRTEHERGGRVVFVARVEEEREVQGVVTPIRVSFERGGRALEMRVTSVDYETEIPEIYFSALALVRTGVHPDTD